MQLKEKLNEFRVFSPPPPQDLLELEAALDEGSPRSVIRIKLRSRAKRLASQFAGTKEVSRASSLSNAAAATSFTRSSHKNSRLLRVSSPIVELCLLPAADVLKLARAAAVTFSLMPPTGSTRPRKPDFAGHGGVVA